MYLCHAKRRRKCQTPCKTAPYRCAPIVAMPSYQVICESRRADGADQSRGQRSASLREHHGPWAVAHRVPDCSHSVGPTSAPAQCAGRAGARAMTTCITGKHTASGEPLLKIFRKYSESIRQFACSGGTMAVCQQPQGQGVSGVRLAAGSGQGLAGTLRG
jgi:hypothetical protein